jgi:hypothetical protein
MLELLPNEPNPAIVALLEKLTEEAKRGEITGIIGVAVMRGSQVGNFLGGSAYDNAYTVVGALTVLQHDFIHKTIQSDNYDYPR